MVMEYEQHITIKLLDPRWRHQFTQRNQKPTVTLNTVVMEERVILFQAYFAASMLPEYSQPFQADAGFDIFNLMTLHVNNV